MGISIPPARFTPNDPPGRASKVRWLNERGGAIDRNDKSLGKIGRGDSHELYNAGPHV